MEVTAHYQDNGYIYCKMINLETNTVLMEASSKADLWRRPETNASGVWAETSLPPAPQFSVFPKWGLYRGVNDSSMPVTMYWTDMVMIKRNINNYRFPDGYAPKDAQKDYWHDLTSYAVGRGGASKASINHSASNADNLFFDYSNKTNPGFASTYIFPGAMLNNGTASGNLPLWAAVDLGEEKEINEIQLSFPSAADYQRLDSLYVAYTNDAAAYDALVNNTGNAGVYTLSSTVTTLDPLGIHAEDERYYLGNNPYAHAGKWTQFVRIPRISEHTVPGIRTNIALDNIFNANRSLEGMIPGMDSFKARYVILYCDIWPYTNESRNPDVMPVFASPVDIKLKSFHMRYNPGAAGQ
jgi:hypothetical protein